MSADGAVSQVVVSLMWGVIAQVVVFGPLVVAIGVTALVNFQRWRIFRSRGKPYIHSQTWAALLLFLVTAAMAICFVAVPWTSTATAPVAVLVVLQEAFFFYLVGVIITRQWVLALLFRTTECHGDNDLVPQRPRVTPAVFVGGPFLISLVYLVVCQIPYQLNVFGVIASATYTGLAYAVGLFILFGVPAFANRKIPMALFYDYRSNMVAAVIVGIVFVTVTVWDFVVLTAPDQLIERRLVLSNMYIFLGAVVAIFSLGRPAFAVWYADVAYLDNFEEIGSSVRDLPLMRVEGGRGSIS